MDHEVPILNGAILDVAILDGALVPETVVEDAGFGALETARGRLPLTALDVEARIVGLIAETRVRQTFRNVLDEAVEATYIFPLPDRAAVTSFSMHVAGRTVDGELKERGQAREAYDAAIASGYRAAIAEEERSGVFSLRVGNLPPHEEAVVELTLVGPVPVSDGEATFRFPLVVAPRYTPGMALDGPSVGAGTSPDTDQVPDASRVTPPVLLPGFPNPVALSLKVELDPATIAAGDSQWPRRVRSSLHSVVTAEGPPWTVELRPGERLNRDFVLRYPVASQSLATSLDCHAATGDHPGVFALTLFPPEGRGLEKPAPRRVVFVLDRSGSMEGWKMVAARRALGRMIDTLLDQDLFTVLAFDDVVEQPPQASSGCVPGGNRQRWEMLQWLGKVDARGGTEMGPALAAALGVFPKHPDSYRSILVLVTDGQVSGEDAILRTLKQCGQESLPRIFTVGIDRAVNAGFLGKLAGFGRGDCELVESEDRLDEAMDRIHRLIGTPLLTQIRIEPIDGKWIKGSLTPRRLPDLFVDRPLTVFGRYDRPEDSIRVRVRGQDSAGRPWQQEVAGRATPANLLMSMWGRAKVRDLEDEYAAGPSGDAKALMDRIVQVSLESHVLSRFTAYVAVDKSDVANPDGRPLEVIQPVEYADGWAIGRILHCAVGTLGASSTHAFCDFAASAPMLSRPVPMPRFARAEESQQELLCECLEEPEEPERVLELLLDEAIQSGARQISILLRWRRIRVRLLIAGAWTEHAALPGALWERLLETIKRRSAIDPSSTSWPQKGEIPWRTAVLPVTITLVKKRETVTIDIPSVAGTQGPSDASSTSDEKRSRFWT